MLSAERRAEKVRRDRQDRATWPEGGGGNKGLLKKSVCCRWETDELTPEWTRGTASCI